MPWKMLASTLDFFGNKIADPLLFDSRVHTWPTVTPSLAFIVGQNFQAKSAMDVGQYAQVACLKIKNPCRRLLILEHFFLMITNWATPVGCSGGYMAAGESGLGALVLLCPQRELPAAWVGGTLPPASHHD